MKITVRIFNNNPVHTRLSIWVNGGLITSPGQVCLRNEEVPDFVARLLERQSVVRVSDIAKDIVKGEIEWTCHDFESIDETSTFGGSPEDAEIKALQDAGLAEAEERAMEGRCQDDD